MRGITYLFPGTAQPGSIGSVGAYTAANNWCVQNAHVKGEAMWHEMNQLVLEDNPSIMGRWAGFRLRMSTSMVVANTLDPLAGDGATPLGAGEWDYSKYVMPQHEVDPATGLPLPADELTPVLIGGDGSLTRSLVKAYEESRATVQPIDPSVPAGMSTSFFNLLTDSGSQEPELADLIEDDNDQPPYDQANYPQGGGNNIYPIIVDGAAASNEQPIGRIGSFIAPCGLIQLSANIVTNINDEAQTIGVIVHVAPGDYKGTMSVPMGQ